MVKAKKLVISKTTGLPVDPMRSRAAKKAAATRRFNAEAAAERSVLKLHHKIIAGGMITAVVVLAGLGIANVLSAYAANGSAVSFVGAGGKCLDDRHTGLASRNWVWLWGCNNGNAQKWTVSGNAIKLAYGGGAYCLDDPGASRLSGISAWLYACNGTTAQKWTYSSNRLINAVTGYCLGAKNGNTASGTRLVLTPCNGSAAQKWTVKGGTVTTQPIKGGPTPPLTSPVPTGNPAPTNSVSGQYGKPLDVNTNALPYGALPAIANASASDKAEFAKLTANPMATWITDNYSVTQKVQAVVSAANSHNAVAQLVMYYIPRRDCGNYSAGGASDAGDYQNWVNEFVAGLGNSRAIVIVEPDGLPLMSCLSTAEVATRYSLIKYAAQKVAAQGSWVYIDAGTDVYQPLDIMTNRLQQSGIQYATGFAMNISMFRPDDKLIAYGTSLSKNVGGKHFVIDTSRNGMATAPDDYSWCNPTPRGLGNKPTESTGVPLLDAYLWIKTPGGSDGSCNGAPGAGEWYQSYALMLAQNAVF